MFEVAGIIGREIGEVGKPCAVWENGGEIVGVPPTVENVDAIVIVNLEAWTLRIDTLVRLR